MTTATLTLRLQIDADLVLPGAKAAVIYRRWGGSAVDWQAVAQPIEAAGELVLEVPPPESGAWTTLPPALGGPFPFGIGYLVVHTPAADGAEDQAPTIHAVAPSHRVLWLSGPFPALAFERMAEDPRLSADEKAAIARDLGALPAGLSLARNEHPTRSLVGYAVVDEVVELAASRSAAWPPTVF